MKKLFAILLAVAVICALSLTAFAATDTITDFENDKTIDVLGTYNDQFVQKYSVALTWGSMAFTYQTQAATWDEVAHVWNKTGTEGWVYDEGANEIDVVNHSSQDVTATFAFAAENNSGIAGDFDSEATVWNDTDAALEMPVQLNPDEDATEAYAGVTTYTVALELSNALVETWVAGTSVGTITISFE